MDPMPLQHPPLFPKRPFERPRELLDQSDRGVPDVLVKYVMCPGYSDVYGNMDLRFTCFAINK